MSTPYHTELEYRGLRFRFNNGVGFAVLDCGLEVYQFPLGAKQGTARFLRDGIFWESIHGAKCFWNGGSKIE